MEDKTPIHPYSNTFTFTFTIYIHPLSPFDFYKSQTKNSEKLHSENFN